MTEKRDNAVSALAVDLFDQLLEKYRMQRCRAERYCARCGFEALRVVM